MATGSTYAIPTYNEVQTMLIPINGQLTSLNVQANSLSQSVGVLNNLVGDFLFGNYIYDSTGSTSMQGKVYNNWMLTPNNLLFINVNALLTFTASTVYFPSYRIEMPRDRFTWGNVALSLDYPPIAYYFQPKASTPGTWKTDGDLFRWGLMKTQTGPTSDEYVLHFSIMYNKGFSPSSGSTGKIEVNHLITIDLSKYAI